MKWYCLGIPVNVTVMNEQLCVDHVICHVTGHVTGHVISTTLSFSVSPLCVE